MRHSAGEIARMLAGRRDGQEWRVGSLAGEAGRSLAVHLTGTKAGIWADFSSGETGDALDLVAAVLYAGSRAAALAWARRWLGLPDDGAVAEPMRRIAPAEARPRGDEGNQERTAFAARLFFEAHPVLAGTPVAAYLAARRIDLAALGRQPKSLRFHAALWNREAGREMPAMVAAIVGRDGKISAVHRTWLERIDGIWSKARLQNPKMSLGRVAGGSIRMWRGASGKPIADAPVGESVVIGEGIETCLSIAVACPDRRVIASVSLGNLALLDLPAAIKTVTIAADNDASNDQAARALQVAIERFAGEGRRVLIARSPIGSDFNDALMAEGAP